MNVRKRMVVTTKEAKKGEEEHDDMQKTTERPMQTPGNHMGGSLLIVQQPF